MGTGQNSRSLRIVIAGVTLLYPVIHLSLHTAHANGDYSFAPLTVSLRPASDHHPVDNDSDCPVCRLGIVSALVNNPVLAVTIGEVRDFAWSPEAFDLPARATEVHQPRAPPV